MNIIREIRSVGMPRSPAWRVHDGTCMPVAPGSCPGVEFRNGWRVPPDTYLATDWEHATGKGFWWHSGGPLDIVAFLPSIDFSSAKRARAAIRATILAHHRSGSTDWINDELARDIIALFASRAVAPTPEFPAASGRRANSRFRFSSDAELTDY